MLGLHELRRWCDSGYDHIQDYDRRYSEWFAIPRSIKTTCIKPSGTVSLLAGGVENDVLSLLVYNDGVCTSDVNAVVHFFLPVSATPGLHYPEARYYLRRVRVGATNEVVAPLRAAGYHIEPAIEDAERKVVITFPVDAGQGIRTLDSMSLWEQLGLAALLQRHWADNQVSDVPPFYEGKRNA